MREAKWITAAMEVPVFVKNFRAEHVRKEVLSVTACGIYEARINGKPVSTDLLRPGWTNYRKRIQVQEYEVTGLIRKENVIEITVAPGWWSGYLNEEGKNHHYGDKVAARAALTLADEKGVSEVIRTDESWSVTSGPTRYAELYQGENIDLTAEPAALQPVSVYDLPYPAELVPQTGPSVQIIERFGVRQLLVTPEGEQVLDFGQNIAGFVEVKIRGKRGVLEDMMR